MADERRKATKFTYILTTVSEQKHMFLKMALIFIRLSSPISRPPQFVSRLPSLVSQKIRDFLHV